MHRTSRPIRQTLPLNLIIDDRSALVVGGGQVGLRKVRNLLDAGARVVLVCPDACTELVAGVRCARRPVCSDVQRTRVQRVGGSERRGIQRTCLRRRHRG